jgi:hypothetical protein
MKLKLSTILDNFINPLYFNLFTIIIPYWTGLLVFVLTSQESYRYYLVLLLLPLYPILFILNSKRVISSSRYLPKKHKKTGDHSTDFNILGIVTLIASLISLRDAFAYSSLLQGGEFNSLSRFETDNKYLYYFKTAFSDLGIAGCFLKAKLAQYLFISSLVAKILESILLGGKLFFLTPIFLSFNLMFVYSLINEKSPFSFILISAAQRTKSLFVLTFQFIYKYRGMLILFSSLFGLLLLIIFINFSFGSSDYFFFRLLNGFDSYTTHSISGVELDSLVQETKLDLVTILFRSPLKALGVIGDLTFDKPTEYIKYMITGIIDPNDPTSPNIGLLYLLITTSGFWVGIILYVAFTYILSKVYSKLLRKLHGIKNLGLLNCAEFFLVVFLIVKPYSLFLSALDYVNSYIIFFASFACIAGLKYLLFNQQKNHA